jgi:vancomycin resistance protein VanW
MIKPIRRSRIRLIVGAWFYRIKRRFQWYLGSDKFARTRSGNLLAYTAATHATPLRRQLRDVDMRMQDNKTVNLRIAAKQLNGIVLKPGETFSYWRVIGKPTRSKGYLEGMLLSQGKVTIGIGGGLCQLSNLIYWMTLHTPLTVTERHRHSYDVFPDSGRSQPFGSGATCYYNYIDLQIKNETSEDYQLEIGLSETHLHGSWLASTAAARNFEVYESRHWFTQLFWGGYVRHNILRRKVMDLSGSVLDDEWITENHALMMYEPYLENKQFNGNE